MLTTIIVLAAIIAVFVVAVALRPSEFRVTRSAMIAALPSSVFSQVNNLHNWEGWSPWAKLDPAMKQTYDGPSAGTGAVFTWTGNRKVGEGRMTITESRPSELIRFRLDFVRPFAGTCNAEFSFKAEGNQTVVTWSMTGKNNFMAKFMGLFMNCDKVVGGQFDQGLAKLKSVTESAAPNLRAAA